MKQIVCLISFALLLASCSKTQEERVYTATETKRMLDSTKAARERVMKKEAEKDLEIRRAIELKPMIDSLERQKKKK